MTPTMAAIITQFTPVTPPPENQTFSQKPVPLQPPLNPPLHPSFNRMGWGPDLPLPPLGTFGARIPTTQQQEQQRLSQSQLQKRGGEAESSKREPSAMQPPPPPTTSPCTSAASQQPQAPAETQPQPQPQAQPQMEAPGPPPAHMDPRDLAMAARIAAFYQQRCHAVATYQQQRCQAWANAYRKKCHETTQAAMLVVAWYVRDRIRRRRRREKDRFRRGLREKRETSRPVGKGEAVRRWVMEVPRDALSPNSAAMDRAKDKEEEGFSMDGEAPPDKDTRLFEMADGLIKSQYRDIDVPLMGVLSFDESDSESEDGEGLCAGCNERSSEVEVVGDLQDQERDEGAEVVGEDYEDYEEELYDDEYMDGLDEELGSQLVHGGETGQHSEDTEGVLPLL